MPRKKKAPKPGKDPSTTEARLPQTKGGSTVVSSSWRNKDCLQVRVSEPASSSSATTKQPQILVTEQDANRINLQSREILILLSLSNGDSSTGVLSNVCIARAALWHSAKSSTPTHAASPRRSKGPSVGTVFVSGRSFQSKDSQADATTSKQVSYNLPTPETDRKTRFSFSNRNVEGNSLLLSPSTPQKHNKEQASEIHWIISSSSNLGQEIWQQLYNSTPPKMVVLSPNAEDGHRLTGSLRILERMYIATCLGWFMKEGDQVPVSFQGKSVTLQIQSVSWNENSSTLSKSFSQLNLDDNSSCNDDDDGEYEMIRNAVSKSSVRLFCVLMDTHVKCVVSDTSTQTLVSTGTAPEIPLVAGLDNTIDAVTSFLEMALERRHLFRNGGRNLKAPKGLLLHGPSGVGKTLLARQMANKFANRSHSTEFIHCSSLQSKSTIVGAAERELTRAFSPNKDSKGKFLILDDVHIICPRRGNPASGTDRLASTLLALMDGAESDETEGALVILATSNDASSLDSALRRPGRLDTEIEVPPPDDPNKRAEIMIFLLQRMDVDISNISDDSWMELGKLGKGFNGADCMLASKAAVRSAASRVNVHDPEIMLKVEFADLQLSIRATKPSAIKTVSVEIPEVHWSTIGGMDDVKQQLQDAINLPLEHGEAYDQLGIPAPSGILLYGPPGCSKTLMARALATEGKMNFLAVKGPELLSKWLGESERALASLFRRARMASPSIIFFDELDAIAAKRGSGDSSSSSRLLSQMLTELDGVKNTYGSKGAKPQRVVVVGATNRPDLLDTALTRKGRMDRMIYVSPPDAVSREQIFRLNLKDKSLHTDIDFQKLASDSVSQGYSGAEIVAICRDAALLALEESDNVMSDASEVKISMHHLHLATQSTNRQITPEMLEFYESFREI